jgi:hypothetical protein
MSGMERVDWKGIGAVSRDVVPILFLGNDHLDSISSMVHRPEIMSSPDFGTADRRVKIAGPEQYPGFLWLHVNVL